MKYVPTHREERSQLFQFHYKGPQSTARESTSLAGSALNSAVEDTYRLFS